MAGQMVDVGVIAADAQHRYVPMPRLQGPAGRRQVVGADVEGHVGGRPQGLEQGPHLAEIARTEFDQNRLFVDALAKGLGHFPGPFFKQLGFVARQAVFGLFADALEQLRTLSVIKKPGWKLTGVARQTFYHQPFHVRHGGMEINQLGPIRLGAPLAFGCARGGR